MVVFLGSNRLFFYPRFQKKNFRFLKSKPYQATFRTKSTLILCSCLRQKNSKEGKGFLELSSNIFISSINFLRFRTHFYEHNLRQFIKINFSLKVCLKNVHRKNLCLVVQSNSVGKNIYHLILEKEMFFKLNLPTLIIKMAPVEVHINYLKRTIFHIMCF